MKGGGHKGGWRSSHYTGGEECRLGARLSGFKLQLSHFLFDLRQITLPFSVSSFIICKISSSGAMPEMGILGQVFIEEVPLEEIYKGVKKTAFGRGNRVFRSSASA